MIRQTPLRVLMMTILSLPLAALAGTPASTANSPRVIREEIRTLRNRHATDVREEQRKFKAEWQAQLDQIRDRHRKEQQAVKARHASEPQGTAASPEERRAALQRMKRDLLDLRDRQEGEVRAHRERRRLAATQLEEKLFQKRKAMKDELARLEEALYQAVKDARRAKREEREGKRL